MVGLGAFRVVVRGVIVVDVGQELEQVVARYSAVGLSLQLLPQPHQVFLVLDSSQVVQLFQ